MICRCPGSENNILEFKKEPRLKNFFKEDILNKEFLSKIFSENKFDICIHLAAQINVQESIDNPDKSFNINLIGTQNLLNECREHKTKIVIVSTCMVYDTANADKSIDENFPIKPASPYAGSKLSAEYMALSFYYAYKLPVVILRPFNTYGPFQKSNMEGGVVSIFIKNMLEGKNLKIFGTGKQTRDLLYVEDCAEFIVKSSFSENAIGEVFNAGLDQDISIENLAKMIVKDEKYIEHVKHHHPQSEIMKLECDSSKAKKILNWEPKISLKDGIKKLEQWMKTNLVE